MLEIKHYLRLKDLDQCKNLTEIISKTSKSKNEIGDFKKNIKFILKLVLKVVLL